MLAQYVWGHAVSDPVEHRRLAAILAADVVGYSRLMGEDETGTLAALKSHREEVIEPKVAAHEGRIVKLMGDGLLAEFPSALEAVRCAIEVQRVMAKRNADVPEARQVQFRIGVNLGDVVPEGDDIHGDGINVAARLEELAKPGGICLSSMVHVQIQNKVDAGFQDLGEKELKNIAYPVHVFSVLLHGEETPIPERVRLHHKVTLVQLAGFAFVVLLLVAGGVALWLTPWESDVEPAPVELMASPLPEKPSIAVLPFANVSNDPEQEYFADGMTDDLITDLSKLSGVFVISRNSAFTYKGKSARVTDVARELGVRFVLEGSVRRVGETVRINAQLVDGRTGNHIWAERYDRQYVDIFTIQDQVIENIVEALSIQLTETERTEVARLPTESLEAYDYYLRGEKLAYRNDPDSVSDALDLYQKAITLDPNFADAYAGYARIAADVLTYGLGYSLPSAVARKRAYEAASRALSLNPRLARSYSVLALLQVFESEHENAVISARKAISLSPNSAEAHLNLAIVLVYAGRAEEALREMDTVFQLNPKPPGYVHEYYGLALYMNHRYGEALSALGQEQTTVMGDLGLELLAGANARTGQIDAAKAAIETILERYPDLNLAWYRIFLAHHAHEEDRAERLQALRLAGLPEWPYGFEGDPAYQLTGDAIDELIKGRTWIGERVGSGMFMQYIQANGDFVERGSGYQLVGTVSRKGNMLCLQSPTLFLGRQHCGPVFRNPLGTPEHQDEFSHPNAYALKQFTVTP